MFRRLLHTQFIDNAYAWKWSDGKHERVSRISRRPREHAPVKLGAREKLVGPAIAHIKGQRFEFSADPHNSL